ncbi:hypothetical protein GPL06_13375 [Bacteroides salyersiae]|uniref:hypothetical protein n=1 Tax=Bacteroides salyersiae TaxID=291644 RepID=UPI001C02A539|nr:hypothetical protein [Bacteroides salyersiae]MBT9873785.1 hypothetical protein [Bacteroides salyersiae]
MKSFKELHVYIEKSSEMVKKTVCDQDGKIVLQTYHSIDIVPSPSPIDVFEAALNGAQIVIRPQSNIIQELQEIQERH